MPPIFKPRPEPGPPVNAASTDDTPAVQGTSLTSLIQIEEQLGGAVGVIGTSGSGVGVQGESTSNWGVGGTSQSQVGVMGRSTSNWGVGGTSQSGAGVVGQSTSNNGVAGTSQSGSGVTAQSTSGSGLWAKGTPAGHFEGDVTVTGTVTVHDIILSNADCAEEFDVASLVGAEPGTVMVIGDDETLHPSSEPYDRRVAGVVSGGGDYKPALLLDRRESSRLRSPVALVGKVCCKVDAEYEPVRVGDLLTTSPTPGHAMKACDQGRAFGAVIGKALRPLPAGQAMIPVLIALQ